MHSWEEEKLSDIHVFSSYLCVSLWQLQQLLRLLPMLTHSPQAKTFLRLTEEHSPSPPLPKLGLGIRERERERERDGEEEEKRARKRERERERKRRIVVMC